MGVSGGSSISDAAVPEVVLQGGLPACKTCQWYGPSGGGDGLRRHRGLGVQRRSPNLVGQVAVRRVMENLENRKDPGLGKDSPDKGAGCVGTTRPRSGTRAVQCDWITGWEMGVLLVEMGSLWYCKMSILGTMHGRMWYSRKLC